MPTSSPRSLTSAPPAILMREGPGAGVGVGVGVAVTWRDTCRMCAAAPGLSAPAPTRTAAVPVMARAVRGTRRAWAVGRTQRDCTGIYSRRGPAPPPVSQSQYDPKALFNALKVFVC